MNNNSGFELISICAVQIFCEHSKKNKQVLSMEG